MSDSRPAPKSPSTKDLEDQLSEKDPGLFDGISDAQKQRILDSLKNLIKVEVRQEITQSMSFTGPISLPDILGKVGVN